MELILSKFTEETLLAASLYLGLSVFYLLAFPLFLYFYLQKRWYVVSSIERTFMYFLVFLFFPGLLLLSPILNLRPKRREINP
ncbi:MAG: NAD(P)H-quinone oxidoreductase subunit L [Microcystaceae cyanobacterium]